MSSGPCRRPSTVVLLTCALLMLPHTEAWGAEEKTSPGYVLMIHSAFDPHVQPAHDAETGSVDADQAKVGTLYAPGSVTATRQEDSIVFHAIPYRADTVYPVVVRDPRLEVKAVGSDRMMMLEPNRRSEGPICHAETTWLGNEGPMEACTVYEVPVAAFEGMNVVTLALHFTDAAGPQRKVHSFPAHFLLHMAIEGAPVDLQAVDAAITEPTPLVMQTLIETKAM